jgi:hypothetical protein
LSFDPVYPTIPGTKITVLIDGIELFHPLAQFAVFVKMAKGGVFIIEGLGWDPYSSPQQEQRAFQKSPPRNAVQFSPLILLIYVSNINYSPPFFKTLSSREIISERRFFLKRIR